MILSPINYCPTSWSPAGQMKKTNPLEVLCKQAIKVMDKNPRHYHHCANSKNNSLLNLNSLHTFADFNFDF